MYASIGETLKLWKVDSFFERPPVVSFVRLSSSAHWRFQLTVI